MGIRGSSTAPLILNDCKVPVENVLGDVGKGHIIAFNILNVGRFKLGAGCVGGARTSLQNAISYAKQRKAFNKTIADFGLIREKIAQMAVGIYAGESMVYRTVGMMDTALADIEKNPETIRKSIEEYAVECSIIKVAGSEMLDFRGGRDRADLWRLRFRGGISGRTCLSRLAREPHLRRTNEINRLIITGWLLKRAMSGQLPLLPAIKKVMDEVMAGPSGGRTGRGAGRGAQAGGERQEARAADRRGRFAEVHAEAGRSAGNYGCDRRYGDRGIRHGLGSAARP